MKKTLKRIITVILILFLLFAIFAIYSKVSFRVRKSEEFSEYESSCVKLAEYILSLGDGDYYLKYKEDTDRYVLSKHEGNEPAEIVIPDDIQPMISDYYQAFYKMTHRYGGSWVDVEDNDVIFSGMDYGEKLIYSKDESIDKRHKNLSGIRSFYKIKKHWYAVYINGI